MPQAKHNPEEPEPDYRVPENESHNTPSQAEGDRETIERDIEEKLGGGHQGEQYSPATGGDPLHTPSQAEGERDEVDEDLDEKGRGF